MNKKKKKMIDYGRYGYFFIAPFFITYLVFQLWPLINTFYYSTLSYYKRNGREFMEFAGLQNFVNILGMAAGERGYVLSYLKNTLVMWGCNFVPQILVSLLLAVWLTDEKVKVKGTGAMKVIVCFPSDRFMNGNTVISMRYIQISELQRIFFWHRHTATAILIHPTIWNRNKTFWKRIMVYC